MRNDFDLNTLPEDNLPSMLDSARLLIRRHWLDALPTTLIPDINDPEVASTGNAFVDIFFEVGPFNYFLTADVWSRKIWIEQVAVVSHLNPYGKARDIKGY